jgi:hypothetical protein
MSGFEFFFVFGVSGKGGDGFESGLFGEAFGLGLGFGFSFGFGFGVGVGGFLLDAGNDMTKLMKGVFANSGKCLSLIPVKNVTMLNTFLAISTSHIPLANVTDSKKELIINLIILAELNQRISQIHCIMILVTKQDMLHVQNLKRNEQGGQHD